MSVEQFRSFIDHAYWGRGKILDALDGVDVEQLDAAPLDELGSPREIIAHMLEFELLFSSLLIGDQPIFGGPDDELTSVDAIRSAWMPIEQSWRTYIDTLGDDDLDRPVHLTWRGPDAVVLLRDVLAQFVQHQGQHRSELAAIVTALGQSPGEFDWWDYQATQER